MKTVRIGILALLAGLAWPVWAQQYQVPDEYSMRTLTLNGRHFALEAASFRGNLCDLAGELAGRGRQRHFDDGQGCRVVFDFAANGEIAVSIPETSAEACRYYCGHNASMEGDYSRLPVRCQAAAVQQMERRFTQAYRARRFAQAANLKTRYLQQCEPFLWFVTHMSVRNDLAVAHKNAGHRQACLDALSPYQPEIEGSSDFAVPAIWQSEYEQQLQAARFNWQTCHNGPS